MEFESITKKLNSIGFKLDQSDSDLYVYTRLDGNIRRLICFILDNLQFRWIISIQSCWDDSPQLMIYDSIELSDFSKSNFNNYLSRLFIYHNFQLYKIN